MEESNVFGLEDLSQDVHLFWTIKLSDIWWLFASIPMALFLFVLTLPFPWVVLKIIAIVLPIVFMIVWLGVDGASILARWRAFKARNALRKRRNASMKVYAPQGDAISETITPLIDLSSAGFGMSIYGSIAEVVLPPYRLATELDKQARSGFWASLFNIAAAHSVAIDMFTTHTTWRESSGIIQACTPTFLGDENENTRERILQLAQWRMEFFTNDSARNSYDTHIILRLTAMSRDHNDAWQRFVSCQSALAGQGIAWSWISGLSARDFSEAVESPGNAVLKFVDEMEEAKYLITPWE